MGVVGPILIINILEVIGLGSCKQFFDVHKKGSSYIAQYIVLWT